MGTLSIIILNGTYMKVRKLALVTTKYTNLETTV